MKDEALKLALKDLKWVDNWLCEKPMPECVAKLRKAITTIKEALAQPAQEPVAVHQFRSPHCADWYDGYPDPEDGHGPYETRTLYTAPPKRERVVFPTMLRKMWRGGEVQAWLDENVNKEKNG